MNFPPIPELPGQIRGRSFAIIDVIHLGAQAEADALLAPLRALGPVTDTTDTIPVPALGHLHMDPDHPVPAKTDRLLFASLPAQGIDQIIKIAGPGTGSPLLVSELRQLGGEFARPAPATARWLPSMPTTCCSPSAWRQHRRWQRRRHPRRCRDVSPGPLGGPADVSQFRRDQPGTGQLLEPPSLQPAPPHQGRHRPTEPDPRQPSHPARRPLTALDPEITRGLWAQSIPSCQSTVRHWAGQHPRPEHESRT
jgi:hypothetical protein